MSERPVEKPVEGKKETLLTLIEEIRYKVNVFSAGT
jgi:hypothetical protein